LVTSAQRSFGGRLRDQRERAQITLGTIAAATKIKRSLLEELERGDLSTWPGGIFRRAFVRTYATAIGLSPESVIEEFVQVFPETGSAAHGDAPATELRLTLVVDPWRRVVTAVTGVVVAVVEAGAIVAVAWLIAWISAASIWTACAVIGLSYYASSAACLGRSPGSWYLLNGRPGVRQRRSTVSAPSARARDLIHLVERRERAEDPMRDDGGTASQTPLRAASR
jgi:hypothetical protein